MPLNPAPVRTPTTANIPVRPFDKPQALTIDSTVTYRGMVRAKIYGVGSIVAKRTKKGVNLYSVKFASGHLDEFTEHELRACTAWPYLSFMATPHLTYISSNF